MGSGVAGAGESGDDEDEEEKTGSNSSRTCRILLEQAINVRGSNWNFVVSGT